MDQFANNRQNKHPDMKKTIKNSTELYSSTLSQTDTHSPLSLLLRCLRYIAMAVPMMAKTIITPMMAPMMLPVVGPFPGRRVPGKIEREETKYHETGSEVAVNSLFDWGSIP